jgi:hypothetical protein
MLEEDLGAALSTRLHEELADVTAAAGLATAVRRRRSRQRWATGSALAVPVLAAGVVLALVVGGAPAGHPAPPAAAHSTAATDTRLRDVAYVSGKSQEALGSLDQYVVHETSTENGKPFRQSWSDGAGARWLSVTEPVDNSPAAVLFTVEGNNMAILTVNSQHHTWYRTNRPMGKTPPTQGLGITDGDPAGLRAQLREGILSIVGQDRVDGRDAVHLRLNPDPGTTALVGMDIWVDAQSFLPLKVTGHKMDTQLDIAYEWLPRTPENLARIALTVPAGFTEVDPAAQGNPAGTPGASPRG